MSILGSPPLATRSSAWPDETACAASARALAFKAGPAGGAGLRDAVVELIGPLGAGKTTFVRHLLRSLGVAGRVKSPTYALMEPYELGGVDDPWLAWHFDFYRFNDPREWEDAGFRELFASPGLKLVEWPDKAGPLLPLADLRVHIEPGDAGELRHVRLDGLTPHGAGLLA